MDAWMDKRMDGSEEEWPHEIGLNEMREGMEVGMGIKKGGVDG